MALSTTSAAPTLVTPNARALPAGELAQRFLVAGFSGSGKTQLAMTLPGKKFAFLFDPNALATIEGFDVDYEIFNVEVTDLDLSIKTLKANAADRPTRNAVPTAYIEWEKYFESHYDAGFFKNYDWIIIDSYTMFEQIAMDRILHLNGRLGKQPEQTDWAALVNTMSNIFRALAHPRQGLYCSAHLDVRQDELTKRVFNQFVMTGKLRTRMPLLFNNVLAASCDSTKEGAHYFVQTRPDRDNPVIRTSLRGLDIFEEVTIPPNGFNNPEAYGLGALLKKAGAARNR